MDSQSVKLLELLAIGIQPERALNAEFGGERINNLISRGYIDWTNDGYRDGFPINVGCRITADGIGFLEEQHRAAKDVKKDNRRWVVTLIIAIVGAITGVAGLLIELLRQVPVEKIP